MGGREHGVGGRHACVGGREHGVGGRILTPEVCSMRSDEPDDYSLMSHERLA